MAPSVRSILSPRSLTAPVSVVTEVVRTGADRAVGTGIQMVEAPWRAAEKVATTVVSGLSTLNADRSTTLREDLTALIDPRDRRAQRRIAVTEDMATIEVRGLDNG